MMGRAIVSRPAFLFAFSAISAAALAAISMAMALEANGVAPLWLANAPVIAALLRFPRLPRAPILVGTAVGLLLASLAFSLKPLFSIGECAANMVEIWLALILVRRFSDSDLPVYSPRNLNSFMLLAGVTAPFVSSALGSAVASVTKDAPFGQTMVSWFMADALGILVVGLVALATLNRDDIHMLRGKRVGEMIVILGFVGLVTGVVFSQTRYPGLFIILPVLTLAAFRLRFAGAAASIAVAAAIASFETTFGGGPMADHAVNMGERILFLQVFIAICVIGTMPMAAILVERDRLLARLTERERQYRLLTEHSNDMIVRIGLNGRRRFVSPASLNILGYPPEELIGTDPLDSIHPDDRDRVEQICRWLIRGVAVGPVCSYRQRRADGSYAWLEANYRLVRNDRGKPLEFIATIRDIGRRREAELETSRAMARLKESHRLLSMAERMAGVGHWRIDVINRTLFWSEEVCRIHGLTSDTVPELTNAIEAYHPEDRAMVAGFVSRAIRRGEPWSARGRLIRADGMIRQVESSGQAEFASDGRVVGVVGVCRDVTDEVMAEAELIAARDDARALAEAKSAFLATMSHEIRTPMTGVLGMIELLRADPPMEDRERYFDNLEQSAALLMSVLDDVLDFSKIESGGLALEDVDFNLAEVARMTLELFHHAAWQKGLLLTLGSPSGDDLRVRGDPMRLRQVIANLVSNAIKFTPAGKVELRIGVTADGDTRIVRCEVEDSGIGISGDVIDRLFDPFVQADASTTRRFGGSGLGLAISRRLVEAMDGTIDVSSRPGQGTTFHFEVRLTAPASGPHLSLVGRAPRTLSILLAEDNPINRALVEALVQRDGHEIESVENGEQAVATAHARKFDVILMDMQMPVLDGLAATRAIRTGNGPNAKQPIIALSADASPERRRLYGDSGLSDFITKPVDSALLRKRLRRIADEEDGPSLIEVPCLNEHRLAAMAATVGEAQVQRLLDLLIVEVKTRPEEIATLIEAGRIEEAVRSAHSMKGATLNVGADQLTELARRIEAAGEEGTNPMELATAIRAAAAGTLTAIDNRRQIKMPPIESVDGPSARSANRQAARGLQA